MDYKNNKSKSDYGVKGSNKGVYELDSMQAKCVREQNKHHKEQSSHGMPSQKKGK